MCGGFKQPPGGDGGMMMRHRVERNSISLDGNDGKPPMFPMFMVEKPGRNQVRNQVTTNESATTAPGTLLVNDPIIVQYEVEYQDTKHTKQLDLNMKCAKLSKQKRGSPVRRSSTPFTSELKLSCRNHTSAPSPPDIKYPTPPSSIKTPTLLNRDKISNMNFDLKVVSDQNPVLYRKFGRKIIAGKSFHCAYNTPVPAVKEDLIILEGRSSKRPGSNGAQLVPNVLEFKPHSEISVHLPKIRENQSASPRQIGQHLPPLFSGRNSSDRIDDVSKENTADRTSPQYIADWYSDDVSCDGGDECESDNEYDVCFGKSFAKKHPNIPMKEKVNSYLNSIRES